MSKKSTWILILCLAAMVFLVSCQRSASQSPVVISTATHAAGLATQPANGLGSVQIIGTQTAMALAKLTGTATPNGAVALPTSTPFGTPAVPTTSSLIPPTGAAPTTIGIGTPIPGTTPVILVPTSTPGHPSTYTLMQGDYPYCIARRFNVNQTELLSLNNITNDQVLQPGTVISIPQTSNPFVGERTLRNHPTTYTVGLDPTGKVETIYGIACKFGDVDPNQIIAANNLVSPYTVHLNQILNIP
jgi:LysM repeat protein